MMKTAELIATRVQDRHNDFDPLGGVQVFLPGGLPQRSKSVTQKTRV